MEPKQKELETVHTIVKAQIVFLLSTLTDDNYARHQQEIRSLSDQHGTYVHFLRRLVPHAQQSNSQTSPLAAALLKDELFRISADSIFAKPFRDALDTDSDLFRHLDLSSLPPLSRVILCAALVPSPRLLNQAASAIRSDFDNAVIALAHDDSEQEHPTLSSQHLHSVIVNLLVDPPSDSPILDAAQRQALLIAARTKYGQEIMSPILVAVLPAMRVPPNTSLVAFLIQLGPDITADIDVVHAILTRFNMAPPSDDQLLDIFSSLTRPAAEGQVLCDVPALVRGICAYGQPLDWPRVVCSFDRPDRHGVDAPTLKLIIAILLNSPADAKHHAVTAFWTVWSNSLYHLRLLDSLLSLPSDTFNFVLLPGTRIITIDDVSIASPTIKTLAANVQSHTWNSLDLFDVLVRLADDGQPDDVRAIVREMLDKASKISPELVHMGLFLAHSTNWNEIRIDYTEKLLKSFLAGQPNHQLVFMRIWQVNPQFLTRRFYEYYVSNPLNITRILDVAQDLKILEDLLEVRPYQFALEIAALASRREYLNLDKWLADKVAAHGPDFLNAMLNFLNEKMDAESQSRLTASDPAVESATMTLNPTTITILLRIVRHNAGQLTPDDITLCKDVQSSCLQIHPRLMNLSPLATDSEPGLAVITYSSDIENEVDSVYRRMYEEQLSMDQVISYLHAHKESSNPRDHEIFSCMLHFLFDEFKFFQACYPARELAMTGFLLGSLIQHRLVDGNALFIAIRYVVDALTCAVDTNLFRFGFQALSRFETRLPEWQPVCMQLLDNQHLLEYRPELVSILQRSFIPVDGASDLNGIVSVNGDAELAPVFTAIHPEEMDDDYEFPPEDKSDKILFIVNNLAPTNFTEKVEEMQNTFQEEYSRWFAHYLVDQRISLEPNNHGLYLRLLDTLSSPTLDKFILHETYVKSSSLLNNEKTMQTGMEKNHLKHIATWLGTITLARNFPIKFRNLSFKDLLIEGYDSGRVVVAITFVCQTLTGCLDSRIFRPPNPWLMAVMSLLVELYSFAHLKLNTLFEIERVCTILDIELSQIEPSTIIRNRPSLESLSGPGLPEYVPDISVLPMTDYGPNGAPGSGPIIVDGTQQLLPLGGPTPVSPTTDAQRAAFGAHMEMVLASLMQSIHINPQLAPLSMNPSFKRAVQTGVDRAVRDIILPVVERSATISGISSHELVLKDFASDPSEEKIRQAGSGMAQSLARSLALVTCKEPLKGNLVTHIRASLIEHNFSDIATDSVVALLVNDNWDIACSAIEKAAMDRAVADVESTFDNSFEARRHYGNLRSNQPFWDPNVTHTAFAMSLPDPLRIKPTGVTPGQLGIYKDFVIDENRRARPRASASGVSSRFATPPPPDAMPQLFNHQQAVDRFTELTRDLDATILQTPIQSFAALPSSHDARYLLRQTLLLSEQLGEPPRTPLFMSQKTMQLLYKTPSQLGREIYVLLLENLCRRFDEVAKEAINWLLYSDDERKYNVPVTLTILQSRMIDVPSQDDALAKLLGNDPRPALQDFCAGVIRSCLTHDPPVASRSQFQYLIEVMEHVYDAGSATEEVNRLLDDLHGTVRRPPTGTVVTQAIEPPPRPPSIRPEQQVLREQLHSWFQQWVSLFKGSSDPEKLFMAFATQLSKQGVMKADESSSFFFRICAETAVNSYYRCTAAGESSVAFLSIDALASLIIYMTKYQGDPQGGNNVDSAKVLYLSKILSIFVLVLSSMHEEISGFQPKPIFRLFSSLMYDIQDTAPPRLHVPLLISMCESLSALQPGVFPGFAFHWLSLIYHPLYMPKLLTSENREGWAAFHKLLCLHLQFMASILRDGQMTRAVTQLYRATLRVLLVLLHDFPDFLSEYYFSLSNALAGRCIQFRNIISAAFPPEIALPDPYLGGVALDSTEELGPIPPILSDVASGLKNAINRSHLDQFLFNRGDSTILSSLRDRLTLSEPSALGDSYNLPFINSLVMYVGVSTVAQSKARGSAIFVATDPGVQVLLFLVSHMDSEGQHHLLNAMLTHLRYPNAHTQWFSCLLLYLFTEVQDEGFGEIMTRVFLDRFIANRPHPWGVCMTFIRLLREPQYDFWSRSFVRVSPEITSLLESIAKSLF